MNLTPKVPSKLVLTAVLTGSLTVVLSVIYIVLYILALVYRFDCNTVSANTLRGSAFFISTLYKVYFQDNECPTAITIEELTSDHSVFILVAISLSAAVLSLIAACALIAVATTAWQSENQSIFIVGYGYVGVCVASLAVDLTLATHFGIDYSHLTNILNNSSPGLSFNYEIDVIRIGTFLLMTITLKGYLGHIISSVLLVLLVVYLSDYAKSLKQHEHSIHKLGVIKAFEPRKRDSRCESCQNQITNGGPQLNMGYLNDEDLPPPRHISRENSRREADNFSTPAFDRSYSWQPAAASSPRPFSYLEEGRRPSPSSTMNEPQWRRSPWQGSSPPVPAPDYSPQAPRRLKSALKPVM